MCLDIPIVNSKAHRESVPLRVSTAGIIFFNNWAFGDYPPWHVRYNKDWGLYEGVNLKDFGYALTSPLLYTLSHRRRNKNNKTCLYLRGMYCQQS